MAKRVTGKLTARFVASAPEGTHGDGGGLWLQARASGKSWVFRFTSPTTKKPRLMGLGPAATVSLADARKAAADARALLHAGKDPLQVKQGASIDQADTVPTFRACAEAYIAAHRSGWRNPKHAAQWQATLEQHAHATLGDLPVSKVDTAAVMRVLQPVWTPIPETATRIRGRIELVLDYAAAKGWRSGDNPARWRSHIAHMLPKRSKVAPVVHHAAIAWRDIATVMERLAQSSGTGALAVRFACLTAARSSEVRGATWKEIDLTAAVWTVPGDRMKAGREHRVPLSEEALTVLKQARAVGDALGNTPYVFPGGRAGRPLSDVALSKALHVAEGTTETTVHGLRSAFRDWAAEESSYPRDVAEMALAHSIGDKVEAAYRRGDLFDKRRAMMAEWAAHCTV